jgi:WD40 repeat protein/serine/threonine protein kinase
MSKPDNELWAAFAEAREIADAKAREEYLAHACGADQGLRSEIEELLRAEASAGSFLPDQPQTKAPARPPRPDRNPSVSFATEHVGDRIGSYKVLQELGEGGCGVVYMAEQEHPVRRKVALKVIKLGMDTRRVVARFEAERQALALMDHPNIAKVLDAGATGTGRPYFVMELVRGRKITEYCDDQRFSTRQRLELFIQVCQAVQHAHQKGIIHRDLKPSNILVTERDGVPVPKVIDFGIAKAAGAVQLTDKTLFTAFEQFLGTPAYMSPEQARLGELDIDTRSDIYSLGVLLYELLTGKTPIDNRRFLAAGLEEVRRTILEREPPRPSNRLTTMAAPELEDTARQRRVEGLRLVSLLRGDLDWIIMKCLEKDRTRRYETANGLARDIERHLRHQPVVACPPSTGYRIQKFIRRNQFAVAAAASVAAVLVLGTCVSIWLALRAWRAERQEAQLWQQAQRAQSVAQTAATNAQAAAAAEARARATAQHRLFVASLNLVQLAWEQNNLGRVRQLLSETATNADRGFEWYYWHRQTHAERVALYGHFGGVRSVAFSPNGLRVVTGSRDGTAKVWETRSGNLLLTVPTEQDEVWAVAFSPNGGQIVTCGVDGSVKLWDAATGTPLLAFTAHDEAITSVAFSPDGQAIVTGSDDKTARIWRVSDRNNPVILTGHDKKLRSVAYSPDGQRIVTASADGTARVWETAGGQPLFTLTGHVAAVTSAAFSPDGRSIVTGSDDLTARVWDAATQTALLTLAGHLGEIRSVAWSPNGHWILTGSDDQTAKVWSALDGKDTLTLEGHGERINSVAYSPDGQQILTGGEDDTAKLWDCSTAGGPLVLSAHNGRVQCAAFSPDDSQIATGGDDGNVILWEATSGRVLARLPGHRDWINSLAFSPDGQRIVTGSSDKTVRVWDIASRSTLFPPIADHMAPIWSVAYSSDGQKILSAGSDLTVVVRDAATGRALVHLKGLPDQVWSAVFSPDGTRILAGCDDSTAGVWDAVDGGLLFQLHGHDGAIRSVAFSTDGRWIVTGSQDRTAHVWDVLQGVRAKHAPLAPVILTRHIERLNSVAFSPDGRRVATGSGDGTIKIWETTTGAELLTVRAHSGAVCCVAFSHDGRHLITSGGDGLAKIWVADSDEEVARRRQEEEGVATNIFHQLAERQALADRERAAHISDPGAIKSWLVLLPMPFVGQNGAPALQEAQVADEALLRPHAGEQTRTTQGELVWREAQVEDGTIDFNRLDGTHREYSVAYAVSYLYSQTRQTGVLVRMGSDDQAKLYLNGRLIHRCLRGRSFVPDQDRIRDVELEAGLNVVVFKVVNQVGAWKGLVHFSAADGSPLPGIKITLTP